MVSIGEGSETGNFRNVIRIDEGEIKNHVDGVVRQSVEDGLKKYLDQEADLLCCAERYKRNTGHMNAFSVSYRGVLQIDAGEFAQQMFA